MTQQVWNYPTYAPAGSYGQAGYATGQYAQYAQPSADARFWPYQQTGAAGYPAVYGYPHQPATNGLAIAALVLGVVSSLGAVLGIPLLVFAVLGAPAGIVGLILGIVARGKVKERQQQGAGMALAGILTAAISLGVDLLLFVFWIAQILLFFLS